MGRAGTMLFGSMSAVAVFLVLALASPAAATPHCACACACKWVVRTPAITMCHGDPSLSLHDPDAGDPVSGRSLPHANNKHRAKQNPFDCRLVSPTDVQPQQAVLICLLHSRAGMQSPHPNRVPRLGALFWFLSSLRSPDWFHAPLYPPSADAFRPHFIHTPTSSTYTHSCNPLASISLTYCVSVSSRVIMAIAGSVFYLLRLLPPCPSTASVLIPVQLVEGPERDDVVEGKENQEAAEVDQCAPRLGDAHHLDVDPGGRASEVALDHGLFSFSDVG